MCIQHYVIIICVAKLYVHTDGNSSSFGLFDADKYIAHLSKFTVSFCCPGSVLQCIIINNALNACSLLYYNICVRIIIIVRGYLNTSEFSGGNPFFIFFSKNTAHILRKRCINIISCLILFRQTFANSANSDDVLFIV